MIQKDKRISNDLEVSDSDEEDDGDGDKKRNNQNYKKRGNESTNGVDKESAMDVTEKKEDTEAKQRKLDAETAEATEAKMEDVKA
jgi:hypothetical protein